ncbi:hypothetical protein O6H91_Y427300 [Diphasiastrum complanatum]|nr:hypothetical protein O6H91_Y427300 [Diphasiastrum complanatum]
MLKSVEFMESQCGEGSFVAHVPTLSGLKAELRGGYEERDQVGPAKEIDRDFLCPICIQTITDAFLTACGHSFCYRCIMTHLKNRSNCPCCGAYLTKNQLYPNFLLNKILKKASAGQLRRNASPTEHLRLALQQGSVVSVKELQALLDLLSEKKRKAEHEEAEVNMEILTHFLHQSRQQKQQELNEVQDDLECLKEDIAAVEKQRHELLRLKKCSSLKLSMLLGGKPSSSEQVSAELSSTSGAVAAAHSGQSGASVRGYLQKDRKSRSLHCSTHLENELCGHSGDSSSELQELTSATGLRAKKMRVLAQFEDLQECYLQKRRRTHQQKQLEATTILEREDINVDRDSHGLTDFHAVLNAYTRYSRLRVVAELQHDDLFHSSNIVSSIEFDCNDEFFATAGVSRRIKFYEFSTVVNELSDVHCPVMEISTRSKLSCLSWNKHIKGHIASSDYEGIVTLWDVNTCQSTIEYEEHEKRAWSVDFSRTEPSMLVSGSDDGKVKVWCTKQEKSVMSLDMKANICCVKYNPDSSNFLAVGSADHHIHYCDLRKASSPLHIFSGHQKAVSYVKFISSNELASASTDSTLRLWDVQAYSPVRVLKGHRNEKNFVGLTVNSEFIACGSETNEVFIYHKGMSKPASSHRFSSADLDGSDDDTSHFISAVCWRSESPTVLAANSQGTIKVLVLAP